MRADTAARRYARAIFRLAEEQDNVDAVARALAATTTLLEDARLAYVLTGPVPREHKQRLLRTISDDVGAPPTFRDLLLLLAERDRLRQLAAIRTVFEALVDKRRGRTRARVVSAVPLTPELLAQLTRVFGELTGKQVIAETTVDPELLAGAIVEVDGRAYDGSLRTQLAKLRQQMASAS
ncbi:MAG: ATP synthase F1 subunit delta [Deltaproteobacteria bacterium]|nr:MAG: ATP synthase F1 subunit delta [Deltaproteobacteria bacterium]